MLGMPLSKLGVDGMMMMGGYDGITEQGLTISTEEIGWYTATLAQSMNCIIMWQ